MTELWERALRELRDTLSPESYETWLAPVKCKDVRDDTVVLRIPNRFYADWISANYLDLILDALRREHEGNPNELTVEWEVDEALQERPQPRPSENAPRPTPDPAEPAVSEASAPADGANGVEAVSSLSTPIRADLNPKYQFDQFIVGPSNQLAHAASVAVGSHPGTRYNPLFIYGGVGLGKTHLVNAIGHQILSDNPEQRILYLSAERFTNEFIWALQNHRINDFRERYREGCDVLLMDDIQFLAGREQTQEEFFHTFNALYHSDRQIVVTSDAYPQQIQEMEERLISRFQSGMVADIQPPELDTRIAILQKKAEVEGIHLPSDATLFIAQVVKSNVRELEGTLLRLAVKAELLGRAIDLELTKESMRGVLPPPDHATTVEDIQRAVCDYFNMRLADLKGRRRNRAVSFPRMVAMYLCRQRLGASLPEIGQRFGGKDHTTVLNAVRKIGGLVDKDPEVRNAVEAIERKLGLS